MDEHNDKQKELKYFVRIANTDLDGHKQIQNTMLKIKGIGFMFAHAVLTVAGIDKNTKAGFLTDQQVNKIDAVLKDPSHYGIPSWLFNRKKDPEDNKDKHLLVSDLTFTQENDIKTMRKIKSYRGIRHSFGLPVRGQSTRSNFRKNKGKVTGVKKKAGTKAGRV